MAKRTSKISAKVARKAAAKRVAAKAAKARKTAPKAASKPQSHRAAKPALLAGGNPQIAKADGDAPVQAYIAAMPGWKRDVGRRLDALIARTVPGVRKAVKWNSPLLRTEGQGWFLGLHCFTKYVKVAFFRGASLRPVPPGASKSKDTRYLDIRRGDPLDEELIASWIKQAAALPGWARNAPSRRMGMRSMPTAKNVSPCKKHSYVGTARSARAPGVGHLPVLLPDEIAELLFRPHRASGCPCRFPHAMRAAFRHERVVSARSVPDPRRAGARLRQ